MNARKNLLNGTAQMAVTAAGRSEYFAQRGEAMPPINKIKLRNIPQPATASVAGSGSVNVANDKQA